MEEDVVYVARLHWILFFGPLSLLLGSLAVYYVFEYRSLQPLMIFGALFAWAWGALVWVTYQFSSLTIKKKQLILRTGLLVRQTVDIPFTRIESIDIRQTILGSLLQYGSLVIVGTGGSRQYIHNLAKPLTCRRYIEQLMHH
jgi:uncharacterized membrane protein YdbT with pleckstrin-like domain